MSISRSPVRKATVVWLLLGLTLIVCAVVVRFVILPSLTRLPEDLDQSQKYEGTIQALNEQAFSAGDLTNLLTPEIPVTAERKVTVDAVDGDLAIVTSAAAITLPDKTTRNDVHTYAVDRGDLTPVQLDAHKLETLVPENKRNTFEAHSGLAFSWPMNPSKEGTALYDSVTRTAQPATFVDESDLHDRRVYTYSIDASGPVTSPAMLEQFASLPGQLPKDLVAGLVQAGVVPEQSRAALQEALPSMPDLVNIGFGSTNEIQAAVDSQFGAPLRVDQTQGVYVTVRAGSQDVPIMPLSIVKLRTADSDIVASAETLSKNAGLLSVLGIWVPVGMAIIGVGLLVLGITRPRVSA
ncbi:porin PorA family protein [Nocardia fluminea]|uniref:porin PorA family protein n=1 Tax=Nocardia fluminea TaxID=134984 RepID=UPI0033E9494E